MQAELFTECAPGSSVCPKQAELDDLLTRFAEFYVLHKRGFGMIACPSACPLPDGRKCKSITQKIECCKNYLATGGEIAERTGYQQAVLDGREKTR
ncbi:MAG: hypothetical protein ABFD54_04395 [Armatimonadota bacterium]